MADVSNYIEEYDEGGRDNDDGDEMLESNEHSVAGDVGNLRPLEQLQKCVISEHAWNRPMVGSVLLQVMRDFTANGGAYLKDLPAIMNLVEGILNADTTLVKTDLIEQIPQLAVVCMESNIPEMTEAVEKYLLPLVVNCFKDTDTQVRKTSQATVLVLMEHNLVSKHTVELKVCPTVLEISRDYVNTTEELTNAEDYVAGAISFMSKLAPLLGKDATERLFLNRFSELCSYDRFSVRKMCAASIGEFCAVVGSEAYEKILLPRFIGLCGDDIWGVRKYCAEVIMSVSCACPPHLRRTALAPAFERLLDDASRWVRISAFQNLGPFISTFANPRITSLAYNQTGELVIVNPKGTEFRLNSPAFTNLLNLDDNNKYTNYYFNNYNYNTPQSPSKASSNTASTSSQSRNHSYFEDFQYIRYFDDTNNNTENNLKLFFNQDTTDIDDQKQAQENNPSNSNSPSSPSILREFFDTIDKSRSLEDDDQNNPKMFTNLNSILSLTQEQENNPSNSISSSSPSILREFLDIIDNSKAVGYDVQKITDILITPSTSLQSNLRSTLREFLNTTTTKITEDEVQKIISTINTKSSIQSESISPSANFMKNILKENFTLINRENEEISTNHSSGGGDKSSPMDIDEEVSEIVIIENSEKSTAPGPTITLVNGADDQTNSTPIEEPSPPTHPPVPSIVINQEETKEQPPSEEWLKPRNKNKERRRNKKNWNQNKEIKAQKKLVQVNLDSENALTNDVNVLTNDLSTLNINETTNKTDIVPNINSQDEQDDNNKSESPPPPPRPPSELSNEAEASSDNTEKIINCSSNIKIEDHIDENSSNNLNDDLEKYNSHQYWYISPELPLDMDIVEAGRKSSTSPQECTTKNVLDENYTIASEIPMTITSSTLDNENTDRGVKLYSEILKHNTSIPTIRHLESPKQHIVPQLLIEHYTSMTDPVLSSLTDAELSYHCAFSFPAVALTLGKDHWDLLHKTYITLAADIQWKVRRAVAGSLHEVATILGERLATEHLAPIFDDLIKDVDVVRIGALKHMAYFFKIIAPYRRNQYLPRLAEFLVTDSALNWRYRCELANQLLLSLPLWTGRDVGRHILPLAKELLQDKVAAVRATAVLLVSDLIHHVESESLNKRAFPNVAQIFNVHFAHSKSWVRRQTFATLCAKLVTQYVLPPETFARDVMPHFLDLSWDPVANVRLAVAKTLANNILKNEYFADPNCTHNEPLLKVLRRLQSDKDRDVRQAASTVF